MIDDPMIISRSPWEAMTFCLYNVLCTVNGYAVLVAGSNRSSGPSSVGINATPPIIVKKPHTVARPVRMRSTITSEYVRSP
jgi:hypothetical protein